jgi:hypothetical protein
MDLARLKRLENDAWEIPTFGRMRVPGRIFATEQLVLEMDDKVYAQVTNVATLPGIVSASFAMPDAHWGYGFPIGGVAAFDPDDGGFGGRLDIACVRQRCLTAGWTADGMPQRARRSQVRASPDPSRWRRQARAPSMRWMRPVAAYAGRGGGWPHGFDPIEVAAACRGADRRQLRPAGSFNARIARAGQSHRGAARGGSRRAHREGFRLARRCAVSIHCDRAASGTRSGPTT